MSLLYDWTNDVMVVSDVRTLETNVTSVAKGLFAKADGWERGVSSTTLAMQKSNWIPSFGRRKGLRKTQ